MAPVSWAPVPAYLDHAAGSPARPEVLDAMLPWLGGRPGNPSGVHAPARLARDAVEEARERIAGVIGFAPGGVVFTSGGTEADNLALRTTRRRRGGVAPGAVVVSAVEHAAVLEPARHGAAEVREVTVDADGIVDVERLADLVDRDVAVVSVMLVNNETGVVQPLDDVAAVARRRAPGAVVHTDAVQALPWMDLREACGAVDALSVSAHKIGGPQGVGALAVRDGIEVEPVVRGGGQERDRRPGTHNVAAIVGFAAAAAAAAEDREESGRRVGALRDRLVDGIVAAVPDSAQSAPGAAKAPGYAHLRFGGLESEALLLVLDASGVHASAGSACASGAIEASHVLLAMGMSERDALGSLRLTLGHDSTDADVDLALAVLPAAVATVRGR